MPNTYLRDCRFSLIVPGMLDADVEEKLVVEGFGYTRAQQGNLILETANGDFIKEEVFILNEANKYQKIISIQISSEILFLENQLRERKVFLKVTAEIEKKKVYVYPQLLVTQGHIFTQVKEPVYTPGQKVKCRIFAVQKSLLPLQDKSTITAEIRVWKSLLSLHTLHSNLACT
uniref:Complement C3/4/5 macroglobulin domain-containing protein n=1 Tax=Eptatretus burgeri TaxID=7764 RepID=A0A8C4NNP5_EPTBU